MSFSDLCEVTPILGTVVIIIEIKYQRLICLIAKSIILLIFVLSFSRMLYLYDTYVDTKRTD